MIIIIISSSSSSSSSNSNIIITIVIISHSDAKTLQENFTEFEWQAAAALNYLQWDIQVSIPTLMLDRNKRAHQEMRYANVMWHITSYLFTYLRLSKPLNYSVSQKTPPTFLAVTWTSIFRLKYFWHKYYLEFRQSKDGLFSHLAQTVFLHYLGKLKSDYIQ